MLNCARSDAIEEYTYFTYGPEESADSFADVCKKFEELCQGAKNVIYERLVFNQRSQKEGERIDNFVSDLKRLALTCEFGTLKDSLIRDRIVGGILSDELRGELLKKPDLTLQAAHDYCRTYEASESQKMKFSLPSNNSDHTASDIHNVKGSKSQTLRRNDPLCKVCGLRHSFSHPSKCPALKQECRKCKKVGHFARMCKSSPVSTSNVQPVEGSDVYEDDSNDNIHAYFASVELGSVDTSVSRKKSTINVMISNHNVKVKADIGC